MEKSIKTKFFIILIFLITGISLLYLSYSNPQNISSHQVDDKSITVIDLSDKKENRMVPQIFGILLISIAILLTLQTYFSKPDEKKPDEKSNTRDKLTKQEKRILSIIEQGKTNKEIAIELSISLSTVKTHINNIYKKLEVNSREELLRIG